jgi:hypothetical protein
MDFVDHQEGFAVNPQIAAIGEYFCDVTDKSDIVLRGVLLCYNYFMVTAIPTPRPIFICP